MTIECTQSVHSIVFYYRKDRLRRSLKLKEAHGGGHSKQTIDGLEDIKTFFTKAVIKFIVI